MSVDWLINWLKLKFTNLKKDNVSNNNPNTKPIFEDKRIEIKDKNIIMRINSFISLKLKLCLLIVQTNWLINTISKDNKLF